MLNRATIIDFSRARSSELVEFTAHHRMGDVTVGRSFLAQNPGVVVGTRQLVILINVDDPYELSAGQGVNQEVHTLKSGMLCLLPAHYPTYLAWKRTSSPSIVIAIEQQMVSRVLSSAGLPQTTMRPRFAVRDKTITQLAKTCSEQIGSNRPGTKIFTEGLCVALVTHIHRTYAENTGADLTKGGLTPLDAQRVITYIEQNMQKPISLQELASIVDLSPHYFTEAFRKTVGIPPYRFLLTRRIERAKELLIHSDLAPRKIAGDIGFTSYTQFITNFRKIVGATPGRFRREAA